MKPVTKKVSRSGRLLPVKNEPCFGRKAILSGRCPSGDRGRGTVGSEIMLCSSTFLRGVAHPESPLTETFTLIEIEDSHSMIEVDKAVTQTAPDAESRLKLTLTREQTALGRGSATVNQIFLIIPLIPHRICILRPYYLKTYHLPLILRPSLGNIPIYTAKYVQTLTSNLILRPPF